MVLIQLVLMQTSLYFNLENNSIVDDFHTQHYDHDHSYYVSRSPGFNTISHIAAIR